MFKVGDIVRSNNGYNDWKIVGVFDSGAYRCQLVRASIPVKNDNVWARCEGETVTYTLEDCYIIERYKDINKLIKKCGL